MRDARPWLILGAVAGLAVWHVLDFSEVRDTEFPKVVRPFFNPYPPAAYRLAEPGDTLDRVGLYLASAAAGLASIAIIGRRLARETLEGASLNLWPSALALSLVATWHSATPGPTFDGWHGLGWRAILDPSAPLGTRLAIALGAAILAGAILVNLALVRRSPRTWLDLGRSRRVLGLLVVAILLVALRQVDVPRIGPPGYWPRCAFDLGMLAYVLALARLRPLRGWPGVVRPVAVFSAICGGFVSSGIWVTLEHRPLARLRAVVPGTIYISAMPTYRGLAIEQGRLHFKTIINLFDESSTQASPRHEEEIRFVLENGLRYLGSPSDGLESDRFLDETLALARDPQAWPILVHCHGCMDRSPAWMGLYRFLVEGRPLDAVFREIEQHRGSRPKSVVFLQYHRKLPIRAPERFEADPTGPLLRRSVAGTDDPFLRPGWNPTATGRRVVTRIEPDRSTRRP